MTREIKSYQIVAIKTACLNDDRQVTKQIAVCRKTICNVMKRFKTDNSTAGKKITERERSVCVKKVITAMKKR